MSAAKDPVLALLWKCAAYSVVVLVMVSVAYDNGFNHGVASVQKSNRQLAWKYYALGVFKNRADLRKYPECAAHMLPPSENIDGVMDSIKNAGLPVDKINYRKRTMNVYKQTD